MYLHLLRMQVRSIYNLYNLYPELLEYYNLLKVVLICLLRLCEMFKRAYLNVIIPAFQFTAVVVLMDTESH